MPFEGFSDRTPEYFVSVRFDNSKSNFEANRTLYQECVKAPLTELHRELVPVMLEIDRHMCVKPSRCISGAFNDARFSRREPVKTYMYLHFCDGTTRDDDIPGFFMDASYDGYRCGLQLYHRTAKGMQALRDAALADGDRFSEIVGDIGARGLFTLEAERYKKDRYPSAPEPLKSWLNAKNWWIGRVFPPDGSLFSHRLADILSDGFRSLADLYCFMRDALINS